MKRSIRSSTIKGTKTKGSIRSSTIDDFTLLAETPPRIWTRITRALLVNKDRRHLFVTPWILWFDIGNYAGP
jgi:hypothetical protein